jgi:hypothetical protein
MQLAHPRVACDGGSRRDIFAPGLTVGIASAGVTPIASGSRRRPASTGSKSYRESGEDVVPRVLGTQRADSPGLAGIHRRSGDGVA